MTVYWTPTPTPAVTLLPTTTYGNLLKNVTDGHFNIIQLPINAFAPYGFPVQNLLAIPIFLVLLGYFYMMWIKNGNLRMATIVGLIVGVMFISGGTSGLGVAFAAELNAIAYGVLAASIAGFILSCIKQV
jgi:hypothetical protein